MGFFSFGITFGVAVIEIVQINRLCNLGHVYSNIVKQHSIGFSAEYMSYTVKIAVFLVSWNIVSTFRVVSRKV